MSIVRKIINSPALPPALGPYSQAVKVGDTVYISGSLGILKTGIKNKTELKIQQKT